MSSIGVLVNPNAGANRQTADRTHRLRDVLGGYGWVHETASPDQLREAAERCRKEVVDVVAICGGDGTFARSLSALIGVYGPAPLPSVALLPAGTMNTVGRALGGFTGHPERELARLVARYGNGQPLKATPRQLLRVNAMRYGSMVGAGVPVGFLRAYYRRPRQGAIHAARLLLALMGSAIVGGGFVREVFQWVDAELRCDDVAAPFSRFSVIYASAIEDIGLGFRPTYRARERPGCFHVFAGPLDGRELLRCLGKIRRGVATRSRHVYDRLVRRLVVEFQRPSAYMIDGDIMEPVSRLVVEAGPVVHVIGRE